MNFTEAYGHSDLQWRLAAEMVRRQHAEQARREEIMRLLRIHGPEIMRRLAENKRSQQQASTSGGMITRRAPSPAPSRPGAQPHMIFRVMPDPGESRQSWLARQFDNDKKLLDCGCPGCQEQYRQRTSLYR